MKKFGTLAPALALAAVLAAPTAHAALGEELYVNADGEVVIRFEGSNASYNSLISVNGSTEIFPNHSTATGTEWSLGSFLAGTLLDVVLDVVTTGAHFHTGSGAGNVDGLAHAAVSTGADGRTTVSFEDMVGGGDHDYNDHVFSFTNVTTTSPVPEPSSLALTLAGLGAVGFLLSRRRNDKR